MNADVEKAVERAVKARNFPHNTCPASRHVQLMAERLAKRKPYPMLHEEPEHCAESMLATVAALYEARTTLRDQEAEIDRLRTNENLSDLQYNRMLTKYEGAESRATLAEALLRDISRYLDPEQFPETIARITAHLGANHV